MAEEIQDPVDAGTRANADTGGGSSAIPDPRDAELERLRAYAANAQATFERLQPFEEDIKAVLEDEGYREFQRSARKSYYQTLEEQKKAHEDAIPASERRLLDELDKRLKPALEEVDVLRKERESRSAREQEEAKKASEDFQRREMEYAQRLAAEQKLTPEEIVDLGRFAKILHDESVQRGEPRFVGLEEAYKRVYGRVAAKAESTPRSLRAKSAAPGIPGASKAADDKRPDLNRPGDFTNFMLSRLNSAKGA